MNRHHLLLLLVCWAATGIEALPHMSGEEETAESDLSGIGFVKLGDSASEESAESGQAADDLIFASRKKPNASQSIDLSKFIALIPLQEVQSIAAHYYHHDTEFQRAYAFLASRDFADIKRKILQLPEVLQLTDYLSAQGLDVVKAVQSVADVFKPEILESITVNVPAKNITNEEASSTTREPLSGLHGMVDNVLEILPQDQLWALFFDEFESNKQFAAVVDSISSAKFPKILNGLQNSLPLRNLLFVLHNNGIYVERIVESVKSYLSISSF